MKKYNPTVSVFGVHRVDNSGATYTLYKNFVEIFNCQFKKILTKNSFHGSLISSVKKLDFGNIDGDFLFFGDYVSPFEFSLIDKSGFEDYFRDMLKIYQIDWSFINDKSLSKKIKNMKIFINCLFCDVILVSEYTYPHLSKYLKSLYSADEYKKIENKMVIVPPSGIYKFDAVKYPKDFSKLSFVWNHQIRSVKNYEAYFKILSYLKNKYPNIPFEIYVMCKTKNKIIKKIPQNILSNCKFIEYLFDTDKYLKFLKDKINIGLGTSKAESFGICTIEPIKTGSCFINLKCNESFSKIIGDKYTFNLDDCVDNIAKCYNDKNYRLDNINYHYNMYQQNVMSVETYKETIIKKLSEVFQNHIKKFNKTEKIKKIISFVKKQKIVTKAEIFKCIGWNIKDMKFYPPIYYAMRKFGIEAHYLNDNLYFTHKDDKFSILKKKSSINDLFS